MLDHFNYIDSVKTCRLKRQETIEIDAAYSADSIRSRPWRSVIRSDNLVAKSGQRLSRVRRYRSLNRASFFLPRFPRTTLQKPLEELLNLA
jgi:hypothetical protein